MAGADFAKQSLIHVIVPQNTEGDALELFRQGDGLPITDPSVIRQRKTLYFDEQLSLYVVLRTSRRFSAQTQDWINRLSISVDLRAHASKTQDSTRLEPELPIAGGHQDDIVWKCSIGATERPEIISGRSNEVESSGQTLTAVWRCTAVLRRPRQRIPAPLIAFSASAILTPSKGPDSEVQFDPYLLSGEPSPENLLAPLAKIRLSNGQSPSLSSSRLNRVRPFLRDESVEGVYLDVRLPGPIPAIVPISSRLRYLNPSVRHGRVEMVAMLDLEMSPFTKRNIELLSATISVSGGTATEVSKGKSPKLPLHCQPQDNVVMLYQLLLGGGDMSDGDLGLSRMLDVSIEAQVLSSDRCKPRIISHWTSHVDFSAALNPSFGASQQSLQRQNRPNDLQLSAPNAQSGGTLAPLLPTAAIGLASGTSSTGSNRLNLTFKGPSQAYVNKEFAVTVLISNLTSQALSVVLSNVPRAVAEQHGDFKKQDSQILVSSEEPSTVPDQVPIDGTRVGELRNVKAQEAPAILSLSAAVEIGQLDPRACYSTNLRYLPLQSGTFQIEPIRVSDLDTKTHVDIHEMPTVSIESTKNERHQSMP